MNKCTQGVCIRARLFLARTEMNHPPVAEIVAIGTEILLGQIVDTNSQVLGKILPEYGIHHCHRQTVGDNRSRIAEAVRLALSRSDIVFTIGGLGPTEDDITREGIADALGEALVRDEEFAERIKSLFVQRNLPWTEAQLKQADRPECGELIENPNGSAPGLVCRKDGKVVISLPGPRFEFVPMVEKSVRPILAGFTGGTVIVSRAVKICGMGEAMVEESLRDLFHGSNPSIGIYAHPGEVELRVTGSASDSLTANKIIKPVIEEIQSRIGGNIFAYDETTLASAVLELLRNQGQSLAVAESCTGGMLGESITSVSGSSDVFLGGVISYSNELKVSLLGVSEESLQEFGAVSEQIAREMASGARDRLRSDWAISITGVAGPDGGTGDKPVGLVYIGFCSRWVSEVVKHRFRGNREFVRRRSVAAALTMLWQHFESSDRM